MERSVWDAGGEGFLMPHVGEGVKKGSGVVETSMRAKAALRPRGREGGSQEQFVFLGVG